MTLGSGLAICDKLQRLAYDALEAESEIFEIRETMQVSPGPEWEPRFARNYFGSLFERLWSNPAIQILETNPGNNLYLKPSP